MTDKEKKRFAEMAEKDKARYDREMSTYTPPAGEGGRKRKKKDPNAPKRPLSAFFLFCHDERPAVKLVYPTYSVGEVAKELGERWNKVTPEQKSKYEKQASVDKQRYEVEITNYRNKKSKAEAAPAAAEEVLIINYNINVLRSIYCFSFYIKRLMKMMMTMMIMNNGILKH
jgi:hypothetical protein